MRLAISTGGGDAPGLNAVIRAATLSALDRGWTVLGIKRGYAGLLGEDEVIPMTAETVRGIAHLGGTILRTTNRGNPFSFPAQQADGSWVFANEGFLPMNALGVASGDLNNDGKMDVVVVGKRALDEIGGVYGIYTYLGDGTGKWTLVDPAGLPQTGKERTWGVGLADVNKDGVLDVAVAFGDVVSPTWRSGPKKTIAGDNKEAGSQQSSPPTRGKFGSIGMWQGQLKQ